MIRLTFFALIILGSSFLAVQASDPHSLDNLEDADGVSYYDILKDANDWKDGPWDDSTEGDPKFKIGAVEKWLLPDAAYNYKADWTEAGGTHSGVYWAGDYFACYVAPAGRSDLEGHLFCKESLNDWDVGVLGTGNRHNEEGWGVSAKPNATSTDPLVVSSPEEYWQKYAPEPLDEMSIIKVTWQQKIQLRAEISHGTPDQEQVAYCWLRPVVEAIDGKEVYFSLEISNGTVRAVTSSTGAGLEAGTDGASATIGWSEATTYTDYERLTVNALLTEDDHEVIVPYSKQAPDPGTALVTRHKFEWAAYIDDNNNLITSGLALSNGTLDYSARIQSSVRPKKIVLVQGTQGKPHGAELPAFIAPQFRDFAEDANLMRAAYGAAIDLVRGYFGLE